MEVEIVVVLVELAVPVVRLSGRDGDERCGAKRKAREPNEDQFNDTDREVVTRDFVSRCGVTVWYHDRRAIHYRGMIGISTW